MTATAAARRRQIRRIRERRALRPLIAQQEHKREPPDPEPPRWVPQGIGEFAPTPPPGSLA